MRNSNAISQEQRETLLRWFADPDTWVGVYENKDLTSPEVGRRIGYPYSLEAYDKAKVGDVAPDTKFAPGWQYCLVAKCQTYREVLEALDLYDGTEV